MYKDLICWQSCKEQLELHFFLYTVDCIQMARGVLFFIINSMWKGHVLLNMK